MLVIGADTNVASPLLHRSVLGHPEIHGMIRLTGESNLPL